MKKKINDFLLKKKWAKTFIIFLIVFFVVLIGGFLAINYLNDAIIDNHIHTDIITVTDKMYDNDLYNDDYVIIGDNNKTYLIQNKTGYGEKLFNKIDIGMRYKIVVQEPLNTDQLPFILQVHNVTD